MAKIIKHICDSCGKEVEHKDIIEYLTIGIKYNRQEYSEQAHGDINIATGFSENDIELCNDCSKVLYNLFSKKGTK